MKNILAVEKTVEEHYGGKYVQIIFNKVRGDWREGKESISV